MLACASLALVPDARAARNLLALAALSCGALSHGAATRERAVNPTIVQWLDRMAGDGARSSGPVAVRGRLADDAAQTEFGIRLVIDVREIRNQPNSIRAAGRVQAYVAGDLAAGRVADWTAGRTILAPVTLRRPQVLLNPGGLDRLQQTLRRPFHLAGTIKSAALVSVERGPWWDEAAAAIRRHVRTALGRHLSPGPQAAIVTAILIGDRAGLPDEVQRRLQAAGTYHVIAISGGNVALLVLLTTATVHLIVRPHRAGLVIALVFVNAYGWVVGGDPSVQRAVAAATIYLGARLVGLVPPAVHVLSTVAILIVTLDPLAAVDVGAWLSFGATFGIVLYARRFAQGIDLRLRLTTVATDRSSMSFRFRFALCTLLGASLAAELALLPIAAGVFSRVSLAGLVLNFVAIPAMALVQLAGIVLVTLDLFWGAGAALAARAAGVAASGLVASSALVEVVPWLSWRVPPPSAIWTMGYYAAWALALRRGAAGRLRQASLVAAIGSTAIVMTAPTFTSTPASGGLLRMTMVDVGQGDAIVLQFPTGQSLLVDCGGTPGPFDIGGRVVTPSLWALGVRRLDWLAITHADLDHIGGARAVLSDLGPREIWEGVPVPRSRELETLRADARASGAAWRTLHAGARLEIGDVALDVRHPPPPEWERQKVRNDDSMVLRVAYGRVELLLTGDAGPEFERGHSAGAGTTPLRILKAAHHGSRTSSSSDFLNGFRPQVALVSAGRGNLFGHPAPDVIARFTDVGADIFRTDRDGAVIVETDGRTVTLRSMTGRTLELRATKAQGFRP
jgi:competence protein ComEC